MSTHEDKFDKNLTHFGDTLCCFLFFVLFACGVQLDNGVNSPCRLCYVVGKKSPP